MPRGNWRVNILLILNGDSQIYATIGAYFRSKSIKNWANEQTVKDGRDGGWVDAGE